MNVIYKKSQIDLIGDIDRFNLTDEFFSFEKMNDDVTIDLKDTTSIDTSGVAYLLKMIAYYQSEKVKVQLTNPSKQLIALAEISNVLGLLPFKK